METSSSTEPNQADAEAVAQIPAGPFQREVEALERHLIVGGQQHS
jgi:hypothetical protein